MAQDGEAHHTQDRSGKLTSQELKRIRNRTIPKDLRTGERLKEPHMRDDWDLWVFFRRMEVKATIVLLVVMPVCRKFMLFRLGSYAGEAVRRRFLGCTEGDEHSEGHLRARRPRSKEV